MLLVVVVFASAVSAEDISPEIDLGIVKDVSAATAVPGDELTYTLTVSNAGPFAAAGVTVVDTLPEDVSLVAAPGCQVGNNLECVIGLMMPGDTAQLTITVLVDEFATGEARNVAAVENRESFSVPPVDTDLSNNTDDAVTAIIKEPALGTIGDTVWLDLDGDGVQDADEDGIDGVTVVLSGPGGEVTAVTGPDGHYLFPDLPAGDYAVAVDVSTTPEGFSATTPVVVTHTLADGEDFLDADFGFNPSPVLIDLSVIKTAEPTVLGPGDEIRFTITVANAGPDTATGVVVGDVLPVGTSFVSAAGDGAYEIATGSWSIGEIAAGSSVTIVITATADDPGGFINAAEVTEANEEDVDSVPGDGEGDDFDDAEFQVVDVGASSQIGDTVWHDLDGDGVQDPGEPGISGATVRLVNTATSVVTVLVTNSDGRYLFAGLDAGDYSVTVDTSTVDSSFSLTTGGSFAVSLADGESFLAADFGFAEILPATGIAEILPATGIAAGEIALSGLLLLLAGLALIGATKRRA